MELDWIWKSILIVLGGTFLLRIAGRKSISQMTLAQTVIMIGLGSLLIQPISGDNIWTTFGVGAILVLTLIGMEYVQIKGDFFEGLITGKSQVIIEKGNLKEKNLKKLRLTIDQLEMNLRQQNVTRISDVEWATLEPNGRVGFILKSDAQPVTKGEFKQLSAMIEKKLDELSKIHTELNERLDTEPLPPNQQEDLFAEVNRRNHRNNPPKHLQ